MTSQQHGNANPALLLPQNSSSSQGRQHISRSPIDSYSRSGLSSSRRGWVAASSSATAHGNSLALSLSRLAPASCSNSSSSRRPASGRVEPWPEEAVDDAYGLYSLHRMFDIVGAQLTHRDVRVLSFLFVDVIDEYERGGIRSGRDFLLALERQGRCDETNFRHVLQLLRIITRHDLLPYVTLRKRQTGLSSCHFRSHFVHPPLMTVFLCSEARVSLLCNIFWQGEYVKCCLLFHSVPRSSG